MSKQSPPAPTTSAVGPEVMRDTFTEKQIVYVNDKTLSNKKNKKVHDVKYTKHNMLKIRIN